MYVEKVAQSAAAVRLLEVAGFRPRSNAAAAAHAATASTAADSTSPDLLDLAHSNSALLTLVYQVRACVRACWVWVSERACVRGL